LSFGRLVGFVEIPRSTKDTEETLESTTLVLTTLILEGCEDHEVVDYVDKILKLIERRDDRFYVKCRAGRFLVIRRGKHIEIHRIERSASKNLR